MPQPAVFLDRDGVIIEDVGYPTRPKQIRLLPGAARGMARLGQAGFRLVVVTNQSAIARGIMTEKDLNRFHQALDEQLDKLGAHVDAYYTCPHHPDRTVATRPDLAVECECRKPKPGMVLHAARDLDLDLGSSWMIGDTWRDIQAGQAAGLRTIKLPASPIHESVRRPEVDLPTAEAGNLEEAAEVILASVEAPAEAEIREPEFPAAEPAAGAAAPEPSEPEPAEPESAALEAPPPEAEPPVEPPAPAPEPAAPSYLAFRDTAGAGLAPAPVGEVAPETAPPQAEPPVEPPTPEPEPEPAAPSLSAVADSSGAELALAPPAETPEPVPSRPAPVDLPRKEAAPAPVALALPPEPAAPPLPAPPAAPQPALRTATCARCGQTVLEADLATGRARFRDGVPLCPDCAGVQPRELAEAPDTTPGLLRAILVELRRSTRRQDTGGLTLMRLLAYILQAAAPICALLAIAVDEKALFLLAAVFLQLLVLAFLLWERKP